MRLIFCQYSPGLDRRPVAIDPAQVVKLTPGVREVPRTKSFTEHVRVLTVTLRDGAEYTLFDTTGAVAKRINREQAAAMGRAIPGAAP
jgi:hypothetical protein